MVSSVRTIQLSLPPHIYEPIRWLLPTVKKMSMSMLKKRNTKGKTRDISTQLTSHQTERRQPDVLVVDDSEFWQQVVNAIFENTYHCDNASTYEEAVEKIRTHHYDAICLSQPFHTMNTWRNLLILLKDKFPEIPVIMLNNDPLENARNIQSRYPNVREVIFKGEQTNGLDFTAALTQLLPGYV